MGIKLKLGSLFDGSGGFPLAGVMNGIEPVWASEIEPFPIRVTHKRFPHMKHLGSVTKINGADIEPVDIITFGSPCQDLSIAGNRAGIHEGERSNLFFEAVRIIKEMRNATNGEYPRFAVWENVLGAFSSNRGEDFRCVLEALCRVTDESVSIPRPEKWLHAGCVKWGGASLAWRVYDAQYHGVPQRRKRIFLVADFGGQCADEILFKPYGLQGDIVESGEARQTEDDACDPAQSSGADDSQRTVVFKERAGKPGGGKGLLCGSDRAFTLSTNTDQAVCHTVAVEGLGHCGSHNGIGFMEADTSYTLNTVDKHGVAYRSDVVAYDCRNHTTNKEISATLQAKSNGGQSLNYINPVAYKIVEENMSYPSDGVKCLNPWDVQSKRQYSIEGVYCTLNAGNNGGQQTHGVCYFNPVAYKKAKYNEYEDADGVSATLTTSTGGPGGGVKPLSYPIDQHQQDSRFKLGEANAPTPTLTSKMGMGGNNTPMILQRIDGGGK